MQEFSCEAEKQPGFVAPVEGGDEPGRGQGKGQIHQRLGYQPPEESKDALEAAAVGVRKSANKKRSASLTNSTCEHKKWPVRLPGCEVLLSLSPRVR